MNATCYLWISLCVICVRNVEQLCRPRPCWSGPFFIVLTIRKQPDGFCGRGRYHTSPARPNAFVRLFYAGPAFIQSARAWACLSSFNMTKRWGRCIRSGYHPVARGFIPAGLRRSPETGGYGVSDGMQGPLRDPAGINPLATGKCSSDSAHLDADPSLFSQQDEAPRGTRSLAGIDRRG